MYIIIVQAAVPVWKSNETQHSAVAYSTVRHNTAVDSRTPSDNFSVSYIVNYKESNYVIFTSTFTKSNEYKLS